MAVFEVELRCGIHDGAGRQAKRGMGVEVLPFGVVINVGSLPRSHYSFYGISTPFAVTSKYIPK